MPSLPFWARDRDTAEQIVQLLPTSRTLELEHSLTRRTAAMASFMPLVLGAAVIIAGAGCSSASTGPPRWTPQRRSDAAAQAGAPAPRREFPRKQ